MKFELMLLIRIYLSEPACTHTQYNSEVAIEAPTLNIPLLPKNISDRIKQAILTIAIIKRCAMKGCLPLIKTVKTEHQHVAIEQKPLRNIY